MTEKAVKQAVLKERHRLKGVLRGKIDYLIKRRKEKKKSGRKVLFSIKELEKIKEDFFFSADNPDYKPSHNKLRLTQEEKDEEARKEQALLHKEREKRGKELEIRFKAEEKEAIAKEKIEKTGKQHLRIGNSGRIINNPFYDKSKSPF